jgi:subtilase family serine protease
MQMTHKEIEAKRQELVQILKVESEAAKWEKLIAFAKEIGASTTRWESFKVGIMSMGENKITETEIVQNIHVALQTASMLDACHTASQNYKIAIWAAIAAAASACAALAGILK